MQSPVFEVAVPMNSHALQLPEHIVLPFLEKDLKRVKAVASFNGKEITFHGAIQKRNGNYYMTFGKRYQKQLGIFRNEYFQLQFFEDTSEYGVEVPEEFDAVMKSDSEAHRIFESFTKGKQRGIIYGVARYKNAQTRIDKSLLVCENLKRGIRDNQELFK